MRVVAKEISHSFPLGKVGVAYSVTLRLYLNLYGIALFEHYLIMVFYIFRKKVNIWLLLGFMFFLPRKLSVTIRCWK